jgi:pimeloyl-ACP methyl ester carboxylesterase
VLELADGRELAWIEYGTPDGVPVAAFHGSPGTRHFFAPQAETAARKGVRLICPDRPGYGHSTFDPGRTYKSWARDVVQLVDHLGLDRFAVLGYSSGGPNAAACARFLAERLVGCAIVSGPAPPDAKISKRGMLSINRVGQRVAVVAPRLMSVLYGAALRQAQRTPDKALAWMHRTLPPCDVVVIELPGINAAVREDLARPAVPYGGASRGARLHTRTEPVAFSTPRHHRARSCLAR